MKKFVKLILFNSKLCPLGFGGHEPYTLLFGYPTMVAYFCHHLSDNYVDLSDIFVDLSDLYVDFSDLYVDLSLIPSVEK